jgi:hypothetical protein
MSIRETLGGDILALYTRTGFGKALKSEIDAVVFHYVLLEKLNRKYIEAGAVKYLRIDKPEIFRLADKLKTTEPRLKRLLEEDYLVYGAGKPETAIGAEEEDVKALLLELVKQRNITQKMLENGKIQIIVSNPLAKRFLEKKMYDSGGAVEFGQNREILIFDLYDFLTLIKLNQDETIKSVIKNIIIEKTKTAGNDKEYGKFIKELNRKPPREQLELVVKASARALLGITGETIMNALFQLLNK